MEINELISLRDKLEDFVMTEHSTLSVDDVKTLRQTLSLLNKRIDLFIDDIRNNFVKVK